MNLFCPSCGTRFAADPSPADPKQMAKCPKCAAQFSTVGMAMGSSTNAQRKFRAKKKSGNSAVIVAIALLVLALVGGTAAALWFFDTLSFGKTSSVPLTTVAKSTDWSEFQSAEGKFRVMLPGKPVRKPRSAQETEISLETPDMHIGVVFADLPAKDKPEKYMVAPAGSKLLSERDITQGDFHGRDIVADIPSRGITHLRYLTNGQRLYTVLIVGKHGKSPPESDVTRVLDSFQIVG